MITTEGHFGTILTTTTSVTDTNKSTQTLLLKHKPVSSFLSTNHQQQQQKTVSEVEYCIITLEREREKERAADTSVGNDALLELDPRARRLDTKRTDPTLAL